MHFWGLSYWANNMIHVFVLVSVIQLPKTNNRLFGRWNGKWAKPATHICRLTNFSWLCNCEHVCSTLLYVIVVSALNNIFYSFSNWSAWFSRFFDLLDLLDLPDPLALREWWSFSATMTVGGPHYCSILQSCIWAISTVHVLNDPKHVQFYELLCWRKKCVHSANVWTYAKFEI